MTIKEAQLKEFKDIASFETCEILEDDHHTGRMVIRGIFQRAETKNANGRIYSTSLWERVLGEGRVVKMLGDRLMLGEVEHPGTGSTSLNRVSHVIIGLSKKGNDIIGEAEVLNTPSGRIIQELFRAGCKVGISSRGRGTSSMRGGIEYVDESSYHLDTFDFVYKPSTPGAFPKLQEAIKSALGPYDKDSAMTEKIDELKKLDVRTTELINSCASADFDQLKAHMKEATEILAAVETIHSQISEEDDKEIRDYVDQVSEKITEARGVIVDSLGKFHADNSLDLDRRIDNTLDASEEGKGGEPDPEPKPKEEDTSSKKYESLVAKFRSLVGELREERDFWAERVGELATVLSESEDETKRRYAASVDIGNELLAKLKESNNAISEITEEHKALLQRYEAAVGLIDSIANRQDRAKVVRGVREAIESHSALAKFQKTLLESESTEDLDTKVSDILEALGVPPATKGEALTERVVVPEKTTQEGGKGEDDDNLPEIDSLTEGDKILKPASTPGKLDESHEDRGVASTRRVLNKRGWK